MVAADCSVTVCLVRFPFTYQQRQGPLVVTQVLVPPADKASYVIIIWHQKRQKNEVCCRKLSWEQNALASCIRNLEKS